MSNVEIFFPKKEKEKPESFENLSGSFTSQRTTLLLYHSIDECQNLMEITVKLRVIPSVLDNHIFIWYIDR